MKIHPHALPPAATDEPAASDTCMAASPAPPGALALPRVSEALVAGPIEAALPAAADADPTRAQRRDGWTPAKITTFLTALAQCGCVEDAARAAGMSKQGAYALRNRAAGGAFALAWDAAVEQVAHARVADEIRSRALHGCVEIIVRDGKVWGERHRFDNRLTMALLTRLDAKRDSRKDHDVDARIVAGEFDQFVAIAARGDLDEAAAFLADRHDAEWTNCEQARLLTRLGNYQRYGVGLPEEIDVSDLDATDPAAWTEEQVERARRAEILEDEEDEEEQEAGGPNPSSIYMQLAALADADDDEEEDDEQDEADEVAAEAELEDAIATGNFVNFTPPVPPGAVAADSPMATGNFVNFTPPTERMAAADRAAFNLPADELHAKEKVRT